VADDPLQSDTCAEKLRALGDPIRIKIIDSLRACPLNVSELADCLELEVVTVSHHLGVLRHAGLVDREKQGRFAVYSLREGVFEPTRAARVTEHINLGCCRLEIPKPAR
jgi:DNA-binding transcriptional ArsR family regulator